MAERSKLAVKSRKSPKPKGSAPSAVELQVKKLFGLEPGLQRGNILPFAINPRTKKPEFGAPQFLYDMARAFAAPGVALSGRPIDAEKEAANIALNVTGTGSVAGRAGRGALAVDRNVLGMSGAPRAAKDMRPPSLLSAVRAKGKTYTGRTHLDALAKIPDPEVRKAATLDANSRGFVNERGKYMDRYKAADYARAFDLFSPDAPDWARTAPEVISENLKLPEMPSRSSLSAKPSSPRFAPASQEPVVSQAGRMGVPVIGREQMAVQHPSKFGPYATIKPRRPENEVEITREPSVEMAPSEVFDVEKLQNALVVPLYGDKSIAGERITSINGTPVSVETYGGPRYGALNAAVGSPSGWASELPQISALRNQIRGGLEQGRDVYGVYTAMSPRAADQTTMMADALLQQAQQAPIRKADIKAFDEAARQIIPNFAGLTHPEAYQQLLSAKQGQRKSLVELMDTAKALEAGLPDVSATRMALTTPELMYAPGGSTGFQVVKFGPESLEPVDVSLVHPTYGTQMAGTPVGHFEQQIPFDLLYPDLIKERRALGLSPGKDLRSFEFRKPTQVVDQETLDLIKKYLQDIQGAE